MLRVSEASKSYGARRVLDSVSLDLHGGCVSGLIGANGAGKTTLIRAIMGLIRLDGGTVQRRSSASGVIGYLPEERGLYARQTPLRTLVYLAELRGLPRAAAIATAVHWLDRVSLPDADRRTLEQFSKGQQQKAQLAAAFLGDPPLIVLDEPFAGLDPLNVRLATALVAEARDRGAAVLLSAHQLNLVEELCTDVVMLARGTVVISGSLARVRDYGGDLESLFVARAGEGGMG